MSHLRQRLQACTAAAALATVAILPPLAAAETAPGPSATTFTFTPGADGSYQGGSVPRPGLIADSLGRLYGVTLEGGQFNNGVVFRLTRPAVGYQWTEEVLHSFSAVRKPYTSAYANGFLLLGPSGELYGTTLDDGTDGAGTVYRLDNVPGWPMTILHTFASTNTRVPEGTSPFGGLQFGPGGLLYGTTTGGGDAAKGTIFSVSPQGDSTEYAVLYQFGATSILDGAFPIYGLLPAGPNRFYGTTPGGGEYNDGTVFSFYLDSQNLWVEKPIYSFGTTSSTVIVSDTTTGPLATGPGGVLYGCLYSQNYSGPGYTVFAPAVFSLTPPASPSGAWTEADIFDIIPTIMPTKRNHLPTDCGSVTHEPSGQLLGVVSNGGNRGIGSIFQISPPTSGSGSWSQSLNYDFAFQGPYSTQQEPGDYLLRSFGHYFGDTNTFDNQNVLQPGGTIFVFKP